MTEKQGSTSQASKSWRVLECNPRWGLDGKATGREVYIEIDGQWGDAGKDAKLVEAAPELLDALREAESAMFHVFTDGGFDTPTDHDAMNNALGTARAAIKKATT